MNEELLSHTAYKKCHWINAGEKKEFDVKNKKQLCVESVAKEPSLRVEYKKVAHVRNHRA